MDKQKAPTVRFTEQDERAIEALKDYYGIVSENEIIRLALRVALRDIQGKEPPHPSPKKGLAIPPHA